jgi:hypothetical protein
MHRRLARPLLDKASLLACCGAADAGIVVADALIVRFGDAADPIVLERVAEAMLHKGKVRFSQERYEDAIATFDSLIGHFGEQAIVSCVRRWRWL